MTDTNLDYPPQPSVLNEVEPLNLSPRLYGIIALVAAVVMAGFFFVVQFANADYAREAQSWKEKLGLVAESRAADVSHFVSDHFKELRTLSDNPSLKLYLSELQAMQQGKPTQGEASQKSYLRNLLIFTAGRAGFMTSAATDAIPASFPAESKNGLAVLDNNNDLVVSTSMKASALANIMEQAKTQKAGEEKFIDISRDEEGTLYIGFIVPIYSIQGERTAEAQIGKIVAVKVIDNNLFGLLKHPGTMEESLETLLVRANAQGGMDYLSPLADGSSALSSQNGDAEAKLAASVGEFATEAKDYRGNIVVATSRAITATPWTLIVKVDASEAFAKSAKNRANMVMFFALTIAVIVLIILALWWYGNSRRSLVASSYFRMLATKAQAKKALLRLVADNQQDAIYIIDSHHKYWFANKKVSDAAGMSPQSVIGKSLADIRGGHRAQQVSLLCAQALASGQSVFDIQRFMEPDGEKIIRSTYTPLAHIPVARLAENTPGILVVEQDISELIHEREGRIATQNQIVQTLVKLVDMRDPFAVNHSMLVAQVAYEMALDMELDSTTISATRTAATLMNIGKIVIPSETLQKNGPLTDEEKQNIRDAMNAAANLLKGISFDGPVAETLRQWQEKWDGSGPLGMEAGDILISARIIAVANAFVGMISPRSWRDAMPFDEASKNLMDGAGKDFDKRVVISLINYVENHSGRKWLKQVLDGQKNQA